MEVYPITALFPNLHFDGKPTRPLRTSQMHLTTWQCHRSTSEYDNVTDASQYMIMTIKNVSLVNRVGSDGQKVYLRFLVTFCPIEDWVTVFPWNLNLATVLDPHWFVSKPKLNSEFHLIQLGFSSLICGMGWNVSNISLICGIGWNVLRRVNVVIQRASSLLYLYFLQCFSCTYVSNISLVCLKYFSCMFKLFLL